MRLVAALWMVGAAAAAPAQPVASPSPAETLARRVEDRHRGLSDLSARFVQTYRSGLLGREITERGTVSIKPPGRMLWEYREPERKTFVADGRTCFFYVPADRQVVVRPQADERGLLGRLLSGNGGILADFEVSLERARTGGVRLQLTPKRPDAELERIYLEPDARDRIRSIEILDAQGNRSRFSFEAVRENLGLPDRLFRFQIPPGVEVVTG